MREIDRAIVSPGRRWPVSRISAGKTGLSTASRRSIAQRIHGIALGYEDLNDHDELRHDPFSASFRARLKLAVPIALCWRESRR